MINDSTEDLRKKFRGTYLFLTLNGKEFLVYYSEDDGENEFRLFSPQYGDLLIDKETFTHCIKYSFPKAGLYNLGGEVVEYARMPERQWKRAPCPENSKIYPILGKLGFFIKENQTTISLKNLETIYKNVYGETIDKTIGSLKYCNAINKNFAISPPLKGKTDPKYVLWFKSQPIGFLDTSSYEVDVRFQPLYQETLDFIRKNESQWTLLPNKKQ